MRGNADMEVILCLARCIASVPVGLRAQLCRDFRIPLDLLSPGVLEHYRSVTGPQEKPVK
jgi:hypothetical protein